MNRFGHQTMNPVATGLVLIATLSIAAPARAGVTAALDQVSAGADGILIVPNLSALSEKLAILKRTLDLPAADMDDALGSFKRTTGMVNGVDENGTLLVVMSNLAEALAEDREPQMILLVPVDDYAAFAGNFEANSSGVVPLTLPKGQDCFAKSIGGHAVLGKERALVEGYSAGGEGSALLARLGENGRRCLDGSEVVLFMDPQKLVAAVEPKLNQFMERAGAMNPAPEGNAEMMPGGKGPSIDKNAMMIRGLESSAARALLTGSDAMLLALDIDDEGIGFTKLFNYKPDSDMTKVFPGGSARSADLLARLPKRPFIFAAAVDAQALALGALFEKIGQFEPEAMNNPLLAGYEQSVALMKNAKGIATAFYPPSDPAMGGPGLLNTLTIIETDDGAAYLRELRKSMEQMKGRSVPIGPAPADGPAPAFTYTASYTENALQLEGVQVDQYSVSTTIPPEVIGQMGPAAGFVGMFSQYTGFAAAKGKYVVMTTVPSQQMIKQALNAVDATTGLGSSGPIDDLRDAALPANPSMQAYVSVGGIINSLNPFLTMFGAPPLNVPADLPPIAMGLSTPRDGMTARFYVPGPTMGYIAATVRQTIDQFKERGGPDDERGSPGPPPLFF